MTRAEEEEYQYQKLLKVVKKINVLRLIKEKILLKLQKLRTG